MSSVHHLKLSHYSITPIEHLHKDFDYTLPKGFLKPKGLWVSVEDGEGWLDWCKSNEYRLDALKYVYKISLYRNSKILLLSTIDQLNDFTSTFEYSQNGLLPRIDWERVYKIYQGIIISPYHQDFGYQKIWYYGWDCSSGCIWDLNAIDNFTLDSILEEIPVFQEEESVMDSQSMAYSQQG